MTQKSLHVEKLNKQFKKGKGGIERRNWWCIQINDAVHTTSGACSSCLGHWSKDASFCTVDASQGCKKMGSLSICKDPAELSKIDDDVFSKLWLVLIKVS